MREIDREDQEQLEAMFDAAAEDLTKEERQDRELLLGAFVTGGLTPPSKRLVFYNTTI